MARVVSREAPRRVLLDVTAGTSARSGIEALTASLAPPTAAISSLPILLSLVACASALIAAALWLRVRRLRAAEAALRKEVEGHQLALTVMYQSTAAIFVLDEEGNAVFMNPAAERLTGYTLSEVAGKLLHTFIHHHRRDGSVYPAEECTVVRAWTDAQAAYEDIYFRKDGAAFTALCSARRVEWPGQAPRFLLELRDMTEKARAAAQGEMLLDSERAARVEMERANRAKDEFVAMLSHELRTPLNAIIGWTALARRPKQTAEQIDRALGIVDRNGRALAQLISDLLDVSRISSGKLNVDRAPVDFAAVVEGALDAIRAAAEGKGLTLIAEVDRSGGVAVLGDGARLTQVVWNLVSNAIKFTPRGGRVEVRMRAIDDRVTLTVIDDGQGIAPAFLPFIFERFRQAEGSVSRSHGGLGLGLAIVKHLVELHEGTLCAESDGPGRGATFTVSLPCHALADPAALDPPPSAPPSHLHGARVLVVDDEPEALELVKRLLEERGAAVLTAASGPEALDMVAGASIDAVVSDIGMPGMDGYELMRRLRAEPRGRALPAVALTAYARADDRARAIDAGFQAHVAKPVDAGEVVAVVARLLPDLPARA